MAKIKGYTRERGYCWKLCPYSSSYANRFYNRGFAGNTNNPDIDQTNFTSVVTALHEYTNGTLNYYNTGGHPGWQCSDDDCPYFIDNGIRYFES